MANRVIFLDFLTGYYFCNGSIHTLASILENLDAGGTLNIQPQGLFVGSDGVNSWSYQFIGDLNTECTSLENGAGYTMLCQYIPVQNTGLGLQIFASVAPLLSSLYHTWLPNSGAPLHDGQNSGRPIPPNLNLDEPAAALNLKSQFAWSLSNGHNAGMSVNGAPSVSQPSGTVAFDGTTTSGFYNVGAAGIPQNYVQWFAMYDGAIDFSLLPSLSPPDSVPPPTVTQTKKPVPQLQIIPIPRNLGLWR